ncbi:MAG: DUF1949 domain-containing protein, partial [Saccharofermentanales bacterium]
LKVEMLWSEIIILTLSYGDALEISKRMEKEKILLLSSEYLDKVKLKFGVPTEKKDVFYNIIEGITSGKFFSEIDKSQYIGYRREIT